MQIEPGPHISGASIAQDGSEYLAGTVGKLQQHFFKNAPYQSLVVALAGAIGYFASITGRGYNTPTNAGLNQYILLLAQTGIGKDAVASGTSKLNQALLPRCPSIIEFNGPGELVSSAGLIKWLEKQPCVYSIVGEMGKLLKMMAHPNASQHYKSLYRTLLQLYSKSGKGEVFDPLAYSDREKNTAAIRNPSLTLFGETVPESFYEALDQAMIADGLLPRFMIFEEKAPRSYRNKAADTYTVPEGTLEAVQNTIAHVCGLMQRGEVQRVGWTAEAEATFDQFDHWTTDEINRGNGEVSRQLLNRAYLKSIKLASLLAIGENYLNPIITAQHAMWATQLIVDQTRKLMAKFDAGEVGDDAGNMSKQQKLILWSISDFLTNYEQLEKYFPYNRGFEYMSKGVVPYAHISQRIAGYAAFKNDRFALKNTIKELLEADFIREVPATQMVAMFGGKGRGFVVADIHAVNKIISRS